VAISLVGLGWVALRRGDVFGARSHLTQSLTISRDLDERQGILQALEGFAALAAAQRQPTLALQLAGAAEALRGTISSPPSPIEAGRLEQALAPAYRALDEAAAAARAAGGELPLPEAIRLALELPAAR
jgi:hypothetical protein